MIQFILLTISLLFSSLAFAQVQNNKVVFQEYYPLKKGHSLVYNWDYLDDNDIMKQGQDTLVCHTYLAGNETIYYFKKNEKNTYELISINSITNGICLYINGALHAYMISFENDFPTKLNPLFTPKENSKPTIALDLNNNSTDKSGKLFEFFPKEVEIGKTYSIKDGNCLRKYTCKGFENIQLSDTLLTNCLKLETEDIWPKETYTGALWFMKNIGLVKRIRSTGRVETVEPRLLQSK